MQFIAHCFQEVSSTCVSVYHSFTTKFAWWRTIRRSKCSTDLFSDCRYVKNLVCYITSTQTHGCGMCMFFIQFNHADTCKKLACLIYERSAMAGTHSHSLSPALSSVYRSRFVTGPAPLARHQVMMCAQARTTERRTQKKDAGGIADDVNASFKNIVTAKKGAQDTNGSARRVRRGRGLGRQQTDQRQGPGQRAWRE